MRTLSTLALLSVTAGLASGQFSSMDPGDAVRIAEAYSLSNYIGESVWEGWSETPFAILLLTPEKDYLVGHPFPSDDFASEGVDSRLGMEVYSRPRTGQWGLNMLATFPAVGGSSTVVVGQAKATGKSSTQWVLTLLHEHFHQYQTGWDSYYENVNALDLSGGDESGMWMLNYPFPYDDKMVEQIVLELRDVTTANIEGVSSPQEIAATLRKLKSQVSDRDFRYFSFQLWQEGVSRFTEQVVAEKAADGYRSSKAFEALNDAETYEEAVRDLLARRSEEMKSLDPSEQGRFVFYALGSSLATVLESFDSTWHDKYFLNAFDLAGLFPND